MCEVAAEVAAEWGNQLCVPLSTRMPETADAPFNTHTHMSLPTRVHSPLLPAAFNTAQGKNESLARKRCNVLL